MRRLKRYLALAMVMVLIMAWTPVVTADEGKKININKASVEELMQLKKVGQRYAELIVTYRENNGPFEKPEDIIKVKGIGPKTLELNKERITVE